MYPSLFFKSPINTNNQTFYSIWRIYWYSLIANPAAIRSCAGHVMNYLQTKQHKLISILTAD